MTTLATPVTGRSSRVRVAIVGGGITGVMLAMALQKRGVDFVLYERAAGFGEIGAGIGFSPNAERALGLVDPAAHAAYWAVAAPGPEAEYFRWVDGRGSDAVVASLLIGVARFQGGRRCDFLDAWARLVDPRRVAFRRELVSLERQAGGGVSLGFADGSREDADIVIGCDGIRSRVRQLILGEANPASHPRYTHKYCFRTLVPMDRARAALGAERTSTRFMYNGPDAHCVTYPVARGAFLNVLLVISDAEPWGGRESGAQAATMTAVGRKDEAVRAFAAWHPRVRALVDLLPDDEPLQKWALFDMYENPAPRYHDGEGEGEGEGAWAVAAVAGDAAHAAGPHLGAGAGMGVEDALVLATVLAAVDARLADPAAHKARLCGAALAAYDALRRERTQWLVGATREVGALFQWQDPGGAVRGGAGDADAFLREVGDRFHRIWDYDVEAMVEEARGEFERRVAG
ncbi:hypothetical protein GGS23DRAFT_613109 [Durotheca rogersii]|uniref:uncharacterized protein n=1 Tax=Durotheca rogersii TaxID=419775 RepID=UPI00221FF5F8|nr:uncharacterized protein GGS23DRAFT_613109 [Durotheca rogersii]KAI5860985.1 hypothetical protein GGS23DRAFT_613109 [Durotheca rogersii]